MTRRTPEGNGTGFGTEQGKSTGIVGGRVGVGGKIEWVGTGDALKLRRRRITKQGMTSRRLFGTVFKVREAATSERVRCRAGGQAEFRNCNMAMVDESGDDDENARGGAEGSFPPISRNFPVTKTGKQDRPY